MNQKYFPQHRNSKCLFPPDRLLPPGIANVLAIPPLARNFLQLLNLLNFTDNFWFASKISTRQMLFGLGQV